MTTTGDSPSLTTPSNLSGGDLVSRLLAATPPYLYNVPLTPHSFFFSEMLRSFVQTKSDSPGMSVGPHPPGPIRRRKRSWRDARDRPLELTTKCQNNQQTQNSSISNDEYKQHDLTESRFKHENLEMERQSPNYEVNSNYSPKVLKPVDENRPDFAKQTQNFFDDSSRLFGVKQIHQPEIPLNMDHKAVSENQITTLGACRKNIEDFPKTSQDLSYPDQKSKIDFSTRNFLSTMAGASDNVPKGFNMTPTVSNSEFLPNPLWYPPYPNPQSYPGIDPLHFFIDLRVSGHIWDRKLNEHQLTIKSKHCSAFSVPQTKEYNNGPLNLTRGETRTSRTEQKNSQGTNFIMKNLTKTYDTIIQNEKDSKDQGESSFNNSDEFGDETKDKSNIISTAPEPEKPNTKDLKELMGLKLTVDCSEDSEEESSRSPKNE